MENTIGFDEALHRYLRKCELQFRADNQPDGSLVPWLEPFCGSTEEIAAFLRELGFKIHAIIHEEDITFGFCQWVETTSGVIVFANTEPDAGLVIQSTRIRTRRDRNVKRSRGPANPAEI